MNITALIGLLLAIAITAYSVVDSAKDLSIFLNMHGILLVIGGTVTVAFLAFDGSALISAIGVLVRKMLGKGYRYHETIDQIIDLSEAYKRDPKSVKGAVKSNAHPFLLDGIRYLSDYGLTYEELDEILTNSLRGKKKRDEQEVKVWHTIARFPPAFGLLGATLGMIALLQGLGEPNAQERIGPAMATALVATFYGLVTANFVLIPISEKLHNVASEDFVLRQIIKEGVLLIHQKKHPLYIREYLKSFLAPKHRVSGKGMGGAEIKTKAA